MSDKEQTTGKIRFQFSCIDAPQVDIPKPEEKTVSGKKMVYFGADNKFPDHMLEYYDDCATLQAIINGLTDYICGAGMQESDKADMKVDNEGGTLMELVKKCTADYNIFGAFSVNVLRNEFKEISELIYLDVRRVRLDEDGTHAYYQKSWDKYSKTNRVYPIFKASAADNNSVFYYKSPKSRGLYGLPMWSSVLKDVQTSIEISKFHLHSILNNFAPSAIVNYNNGVPTEEQQKEFETLLNKKFSGSENASRLLVSFNDNKEAAVTIERLSEDNFDKKYEALAKSVKENIFIAFRAHPQLFGADPERQGFNGVEYVQSFSLFKTTVVSPLQGEIESAFAKLGDKYAFKLNEFEVTIPDTTTGEEATI